MSGATSSRKLQLHPLVLLNIADQTTRLQQAKVEHQAQLSRPPVAIAALLGQFTDDNKAHLYNSFELKFNTETETDPDADPTQLDRKFFDERLKQYAEVFPSLEFLGLYVCCAGKEVFQLSIPMIKSFLAGLSAEYLLHVDCHIRKSSGSSLASAGSSNGSVASSALSAVVGEDVITFGLKDIHVYEKSAGTTGVGAVWEVSQERFDVASTEVERITTQQLATGGDGEGLAQYANHKKALLRSTTMLRDRIDLLLGFLHAQQSIDSTTPRSPEDEQTLREIALLCAQLQRDKVSGSGAEVGEASSSVKTTRRTTPESTTPFDPYFRQSQLFREAEAATVATELTRVVATMSELVDLQGNSTRDHQSDLPSAGGARKKRTPGGGVLGQVAGVRN
ncbi:unnamed protein product [Amoebophrya sp. A120]|nr:unnamed protein product [Amoebophrya sp. A120]|eukprot:GSA120T00000569001.1